MNFKAEDFKQNILCIKTPYKLKGNRPCEWYLLIITKSPTRQLTSRELIYLC